MSRQLSLAYCVLALAVCSAGLVLLYLNTSNLIITNREGLVKYSFKRPSSHSSQTSALPAPLFNNTLFAWGARITMLSPTQPVFELFVQGEYHFRKKTLVVFTGDLKETLAENADFADMGLICKTDNNKTYPLVWRDNYNVDMKAAACLYRFHCPIDLDLLHQQHYVQIEIISSQFGSVYFEIPTATHSIGLAGPNNTHVAYPLHLQPKVKYMLCNGGIRENGLHLVPEWLQHHTRMGFQHFMLGIDDDKDATLYNKTLALLEPLVEAGIVVLYTFHTPREYIASINKADVAKNIFYAACLSYAKGKAEYIANWDLDEFWVPISTENLPPQGESYLDRLVHDYLPPPTCEDWCFISFPSSTNRFNPRHRGVVRQVAGEIPMRTNASDYIWQKSIARVKNTFHIAPHTYGSCLPNGRVGDQETSGRYDGCGAKVPHLGLMHHFMNIFRGKEDYNENDTLIRNEYSEFTLKKGYPAEFTRVVDDDKRPSKFIFDRVPPA